VFALNRFISLDDANGIKLHIRTSVPLVFVLCLPRLIHLEACHKFYIARNFVIVTLKDVSIKYMGVIIILVLESSQIFTPMMRSKLHIELRDNANNVVLTHIQKRQKLANSF
jgi:hypothetical protein